MQPIPDLIPLSTGAPGLRTRLHVETAPDPADLDLLTIRASDASLDRDGEIVDPAGWDLAHYLRNPVIQNAHNYGDIIFTIGRAERTEIRDGALMQTWRFASDVNPMARIARGLYRGGFLNACSVGFIPIKWEYGNDQAGYRRKFIRQELIEVSAVAVPSNPNALVQGLKSGAVRRADLQDALDLVKTISTALESTLERPAHGTSGNGAESAVKAQALLKECHQLARDLEAIWKK